VQRRHHVHRGGRDLPRTLLGKSRPAGVKATRSNFQDNPIIRQEVGGPWLPELLSK